MLSVTGEVGITSNLGSETFGLSGSGVIDWDDEQLSGSHLVVAAELVQLNLTGQSLVGTITVHESAALASDGELEGIPAAPLSFPASAYFDVYIDATAPANPGDTTTLSNSMPLHMVPTDGNGVETSLIGWPPTRQTFEADTTPCVPLLPAVPLDACITSLEVRLRSSSVGGVTALAAAQGDQHAAQRERQDITSTEGAVIGGVAFGSVLVMTGAAWYLRRRRPR